MEITAQKSQRVDPKEGGALLARLKSLFSLPAVILALVALVATQVPIHTNDTWWHIRTGDWIVQNAEVPQQDVFSHTIAGKEWISHYWGASTLLYLTHEIGGVLGIRILNSVACAFAVMMLFFLYRRASGRAWLAAAVLLVVMPDFVGRFNWRPETFSIPFLVLVIAFLLRLDRSRSISPKELVLWGLAMALWTNLHSMSLLALMCTGAIAGGDLATWFFNRWLRLPDWEVVTRASLVRTWSLFGVGLLACLATPNTYLVYTYLFESARHSLGAPLFIAEWQSPVAILSDLFAHLHQIGFSVVGMWHLSQFIFLLVPLFFFASLPLLVRYKRVPTLGEIGLGLYCVYMASSVVRLRYLLFVPLFWVAEAVAAVIEAESQSSEGQPNQRTGWRTVVLTSAAVLIAGIGAGALLDRPISSRLVEEDNQPVGMANFLDDADVGGRLFNSYNSGGYLIFRLAGRYPVFIDGRNVDYERADPNITRDYVAIERQIPGFRELLRERGVEVLLSDHRFFFPTEEELRELAWTDSDGGLGTTPAPEEHWRESIAPDRLPGDEWKLVFAGLDGTVYVRDADNSERYESFARYFDRIGVPLDPDGAPDLARLILDRPDLAGRWRVLPRDAKSLAWTIANRPETEEAVEAWVSFGRALMAAGLYRDAAHAFDRALDTERYDLDALHGSAHVHHLLGENETALARLESALLAGDQGVVPVLLEHCRKHRPPASPLVRRLPELDTLFERWQKAELAGALNRTS